MNVVIAVDSFKGCLTSLEAGASIAEGIRRVDTNVKILIRPLADGGEGTVEAFVNGLNGIMEKVTVTGPLGTQITCEYGIVERTKTAVIEMSKAAGLTLVLPEKRNPL